MDVSSDTIYSEPTDRESTGAARRIPPYASQTGLHRSVGSGHATSSVSVWMSAPGWPNAAACSPHHGYAATDKILAMILARLGRYSDRARARAVCRQWRQLAPSADIHALTGDETVLAILGCVDGRIADVVGEFLNRLYSDTRFELAVGDDGVYICAHITHMRKEDISVVAYSQDRHYDYHVIVDREKRRTYVPMYGSSFGKTLRGLLDDAEIVDAILAIQQSVLANFHIFYDRVLCRRLMRAFLAIADLRPPQLRITHKYAALAIERRQRGWVVNVPTN